MKLGQHAMTATPRGDYTPDADLLILMGRWRRVGWLFISVSVVLVVAALIVGGLILADNRSLINHQQAQLRAAQQSIDASCAWWRDVGNGDFLGPVPDRSGRALVVIIADSRTAFVGQGCSGQLPPVSPKLARWASYFKLRIMP